MCKLLILFLSSGSGVSYLQANRGWPCSRGLLCSAGHRNLQQIESPTTPANRTAPIATPTPTPAPANRTAPVATPTHTPAAGVQNQSAIPRSTSPLPTPTPAATRIMQSPPPPPPPPSPIKALSGAPALAGAGAPTGSRQVVCSLCPVCACLTQTRTST